jgi:predicted O-linked N-acetylglucosamine transferase (SPINDLY family)
MATKTRLQVAAELLGQGRLAEAKARLVKEVRLAPRSAPASELLGAVLFEMGSHAEAVQHLHRAMRLAPDAPGPHLNLGKALVAVGRLDEATDILAGAVRRWPRIPEGRHSYGNVLLARGQLRAALEEFRAAIALAPKAANLYVNLALAHSELNEHEKVCEVAEQLLRLDPGSAPGTFLLVRSRQMLCDWDGCDARLAAFQEHVRQGRFERGMPLLCMLFWDDAAFHRLCADLATKHYTAAHRAALPLSGKAARRAERIRIAYVSADFNRHPVTRVIAGLIEAHDRHRFEVVGISIGKDDKSPERRRMEQAFDRFVDVHGQPTDAIVRSMREMEVDIAVDLMGYTQDGRPEIFVSRTAPIQAGYLGFPGTSGLASMDYLIVDPFIAAGELRATATEKLVILPESYMCGDRLGGEPAEPPTRAGSGLPEDAFVLCSFNDRRKLTPEVFDLWMRILRRIERGVLWLAKPPEAAMAALRREAEARGVNPNRILFADRVPSHAQHIARNALPDLHLDTFPYNAHTVATDALRAGCPILTRAGASFPARVCGGLLTTIGVPELITHSAEAYEAMAVRLADEPDLLAGLRRRIARGRIESPIFDPARFARSVERAYEAMVSLSRAGKPPAEIDVRALVGSRAYSAGTSPPVP